MTTWLRNQGFRKGIGDHNLYVIIEGDRTLVLVLDMDDLLFTSNCERWASWFKHQLQSRFEMSEMNQGTVTLYLKAEFIIVLERIFITQRAYARQTLILYSLQDCTPMSTPMVETRKSKVVHPRACSCNRCLQSMPSIISLKWAS